MSKHTITVTAYIVCAGGGREATTPTRDYAEAKAECLRLMAEDPTAFYHIERRPMEVES